MKQMMLLSRFWTPENRERLTVALLMYIFCIFVAVYCLSVDKQSPIPRANASRASEGRTPVRKLEKVTLIEKRVASSKLLKAALNNKNAVVQIEIQKPSRHSPEYFKNLVKGLD